MLRPMAFKLPESVLVVVHTPALDVLLLERARNPGFWQSVTGSREPDDPDLEATARRELLEETGLSVGTLTDCQKPGWAARSSSSTCNCGVCTTTSTDSGSLNAIGRSI